MSYRDARCLTEMSDVRYRDVRRLTEGPLSDVSLYLGFGGSTASRSFLFFIAAGFSL